MDLTAAIELLRIEKKRIDLVIAQLEQMDTESLAKANPQVAVQSRRGRKSMSLDERQQVSLRMKNYWAKRRKSTEHQSPLASALNAGGLAADT